MEGGYALPSLAMVVFAYFPSLKFAGMMLSVACVSVAAVSFLGLGFSF